MGGRAELVSQSKTATTAACSKSQQRIAVCVVCVQVMRPTVYIPPRTLRQLHPPYHMDMDWGATAGREGQPPARRFAEVHAAAASESALAQAKVKPEP